MSNNQQNNNSFLPPCPCYDLAGLIPPCPYHRQGATPAPPRQPTASSSSSTQQQGGGGLQLTQANLNNLGEIPRAKATYNFVHD